MFEAVLYDIPRSACPPVGAGSAERAGCMATEDSSERLGRHRWTIERTGARLGGWRRLRVRYERSSERFYALAMLACAVICFNALQQPPW
jgi:transposase